MEGAIAFQISACDGEARTGRLETGHGRIDTPAFMPVATYGAVRGVSPAELAAIGAHDHGGPLRGQRPERSCTDLGSHRWPTQKLDAHRLGRQYA